MPCLLITRPSARCFPSAKTPSFQCGKADGSLFNRSGWAAACGTTGGRSKVGLNQGVARTGGRGDDGAFLQTAAGYSRAPGLTAERQAGICRCAECFQWQRCMLAGQAGHNGKDWAFWSGCLRCNRPAGQGRCSCGGTPGERQAKPLQNQSAD